MLTIAGGIIIAMVVIAALPLIFWGIVLLIFHIFDKPTHHRHPTSRANPVTQKEAQSAKPVSPVSASSDH
jgi:hypothetical protein